MADDGATFVFDTNIEDVVNRIVAGLEKVQRTVSNEGGAATSKLTSNLPRDIGIIVGDAQVQIDKLNKALSAGTLKGSLTKGYQGVVTDLNKAIGRITAGRGLTLDVGLKFATGPIKELIKSLQTQLAAAANSTNKIIASKAGSGVLQNRTVDFTAGAKAGDAANKEYAKQVRKRADQVARSARFAQISAEEDAKAAVFAKSTRRNRGREADSTKKIADTAFNESEKVARAARDAQTTREQIAAEQEKTLRLAREANARAQNSTSATATDSTSSTTRRATLPAQPTTAATNRAADKPERTTVVVPAPVVNVTPVVAPAPVVRVTVTGDGGDVSDVAVAPASTSSTRALAVGAVESVQPVRKRKKKKPAPDPAPAPAPRGEPPAAASARAAREIEETKKTNDVLAKVAKAAVQPKPATTPPPAPAPAPVPPRVVPAPAPAPAPAPRRPQPAPARAQFLPPPLPFAAPPNVTPTQAETRAYLRALERRRQIARPSGRLPDFIAPPPGSTRDRIRGKSNAAQDDGDRGSIPLFPDDGRFLGIPLPGRANAELRAQKNAARLKQEQQQRARAAFFQQARPKRRDHDDLTPFNGFVDPPELANLPGQGEFPLIPSQSKKPIQGDTRLDRINQLREAVQRAIASGDHDAIARAQRLSSDAPTPPGAVPLRTGPTPLEQFNAAVAKRAQDEVDRTNRQTQSDLQALNRRFFAHPEQFSPRSQTPYLPSTREEMERANDAAGELPEPNYRKSISDDRFNSARKRRQRFAIGSFFGFQQTRGQQNEPLVGRQRAVENPERPLSGTDAARRMGQRIVGENRRRLGFPQDLEPFRRGAQIGRQADPPASRLQRFRDAIRKLPRDDRGSIPLGPDEGRRFLGIGQRKKITQDTGFDQGISPPIGPSDGGADFVNRFLGRQGQDKARQGTRNVAASGVGFLRERLDNPPVPPAPLTELTNRLLGQRTTAVRGAGRFEDLLRGTASPASRAGFVPPPAVPAAALEPFTLAPRQRREPASATKAFSRELDHTYDSILGKYHEIDAAAGEHVRAVRDPAGFLAPPLLPEAARKKQQLPVLTDGNQPGAQEPPASTPPKRRVPGATGGGSAGGQPPNKPPTGGSGTPAGGDDEEEPKLSPQAKAARTRRDKAIREGEQIAAEAKAKHVQDGSLTQSDVLARLTDTAKARLSAGLDAVANKKGILSNFQDAPRLHDLFGLNKQDFQAGKPDFVNPIDRTNLVPDQGANITEKTAINNRILGELRAIERELEAQEQATGQSAREAAAITEALRHQRAAAAAAAAAAPPPAPVGGAGGASGGKGGGQGGAGTGGAPPASGDDENTPPPLNTRSNQRRVSKRQLLANRDLLTEGSGPDQKLAEGVIPLSDKFVVDTRNGLKRLYQRVGVGFKEIAASTDAGTEYLTQIRKLPAAIRRLEAEARRIEREAQAAGGAAGGGGLGGGGGGGLVGGGRGGRGGGGGDEPQSILGNFLKGATSGSHYNGRGGGSQSIQGRLNGIALAAGTTAKYAVLGSAFYALQAAAAAAGAEILDFKDSYTELNIALNGALPDAGGDLKATQTTISRLADSASLAGTNVGEAMDQAASAVRAFKNTTADGSEASQKELEALGVTFATEASKIATISKTTLTDAGGNLKATALAFDVPVSGLSRITDVLAGAKQAGGGNEKDIGQGIASAAVAAKEAGFSLEETGVLISRIVAETDESGAAAATRFSKITAILGGSAGKTALIKLNDSLAPTQQIDTSADVKTQVQQLSQVYESLSEAQRQQLVNSLGGTANARELIVLLSSADDLIKKADQGFTGKGAEEYEKRLQDIRAVLTQIRGNIKNIIVALANTGVLAPFGLLIKDGLLPALELVRHLIEAFNLIPKPIRYTAFALAEVLAVLVAIRAVTARGGIKEFIGGVEEIVAPGRTVSRRANAAAKEAAEAAAQSAAGAAAGAAAQGAEGAAAGAAGAAGKAGRLGRLGRLGTLGRVGVGAIGVAGVLSAIALFGQSVYSAGQKVDEASGAFQKLSKAPKDFTVAALRDSSLNLATNAHQLNDASSGFFGTIANQQSDTGGTGILAKAATEEAQFQSQQATRLERAQAAARQERGTRLGDTIDLSTPESLSASLEGLQGAGRNATTQMRALLDAMDQLGTGSVTASNRLTELQRITISGQAGTAFQVNFNDSLAKQREAALDEKIVPQGYAGLGQLGTAYNKLKRGTGNIASFGVFPLLRRRDNAFGRKLRNDREDAAFDLGKIDSQKLGKGITDVSNNFLRDKTNASIDTKAGKDGLKAIYLEFFKKNYPDIKAATRDSLIDDALQQTVAAYKSVAAPRADLKEKIANALAAAPAAAQKAAEEAGNAAALGKGQDGQNLASARSNLDTLLKARRDALAAGASPASLEQNTQDIAAARVQFNAGLQGRAAQTQALTLSKIPQESTSARNQSAIDALNTQLGIDPKTGKRKFHYVDKTIASTRHYNEHTGKVDGVAEHTERTKVFEGPTLDAGQRDEANAALNDALAAQQAQKVKDKAAKRRAKIDPRDEVGNAAADTKDAQDEFDRLKANGTKGEALDTAALNLTKAQQAEASTRVDAAIAQRNVNAIPESSLDTATRNLKDGQDHLKVLEKDSIAYNQQLAANIQAAKDVAQAQLDVASIQRQLNIDLTNPVQVANEQVVTAKAALAKAKKDTSGKDVDPLVRAQVVGTAELNLRNAEANAESAAFSQFLSSADTAQQLGRISHKAYLALLQGRKDQIDAEIAGLKKNDPQRQLLQDESDKLALSIKSGSDALSGVFNIGDIKTPTPYEVRKAIQDKDFGTVLGSNPASSTSGNVTNDTSTKNVVLNGVPVDTILTMIQELFGLKVRSSGGRKK